MSSLQDQLLNAGLVDAKQVKKVSKEKRKAAKAAKHNKNAVDEAQLERERQRAEKARRDTELNRQRDEQLQRKAIAAQIQQLIQTHKQPRHTAGEEQQYNFTDGKLIKKLRVDPTVNRQLINGQLAIAKTVEGRYELVPRVVAEKIRQRDESSILVLNESSSQQAVEDDDPYRDYQIPDDLMW